MSDGIQVLLVEDDPDFADVTETFLQEVRGDFDIRHVEDAMAALDHLETEPVDCIVSDYDMPGTDGLELLETVRAEDGDDLPFILFTGKGSEEIASEAISAGVTDYLQKAGTSDQYERLANSIEQAVGRAEAEGALRRTESQFRTMVETAPVPMLVYEESTAIRFANEAAAEVAGVPNAEDLVGHSVTEFIRPDDIAAARDRMETLFADREATEPRRYTLESADDEPQYAIVAAAPLDYEGDPCAQVVLKDITEQVERQRQLERQNERLQHFTSVVSHDLRNPLNVATSSTELIADECDSEHLPRLERSLARMEVLIDELLTLAKQGEAVGETEPLDLEPLAEGCWETVETDGATLDVADSPTVEGDEHRVHELLSNLFANAVEHAPADGDDGPDPEDLTVRVGRCDGGFYVADDGTGVSEGVREQIFQPGFTETEHGTGFGLSIVREIAEAHDWSVRLTDSAEGGARFEFRETEPGEN